MPFLSRRAPEKHRSPKRGHIDTQNNNHLDYIAASQIQEKCTKERMTINTSKETMNKACSMTDDLNSEDLDYLESINDNDVFITQSEPLDHSLADLSGVGLATQLREKFRNNCKTVPEEKEVVGEQSFYGAKKESQALSFYGLPVKVKALLETHHGISALYDWQDECLSLKAVEERRNLVFSLPTSGGKTLVAEILALKELLCRRKNVIFIFPFVCIVQEKVRSMASFALELDFVVEEYAGGKGSFPPQKRRKKSTIFISTIEKAHMLVNSLIENERISEIGLVVVDELHMLFEGGDRGADLEMLLTKLKLFAEGIHIVGMSATINNMQDIKKFFNAEVYKRNFRPVELKEYVKVENKVWSVDYHDANEFNLVEHRITSYPAYTEQQKLHDPDQILGLLSEVLPEHSCLIFCPTKKQCQNLSLLLCNNFPKDWLTIRKHEREALLTALKAEVGGGGLCPVLRRSIPFGIAHHHSGLTTDERKLIEEAYSYGTLWVLTCTSTLAAGVNLPAKRVIIRSPYVGSKFLSSAQYKQMVGRAGRAGLDTSGESYVIVKVSDQRRVNELLSLPESNSSSSLFSSGRRNIHNFVLSLVGLKLSKDIEELKSFVWQTLYGIQNPLDDVFVAVEEAVKQLLNMDLISQSEKTQQLTVTSLGTAVVRSGVEIHLCKTLRNHLKNALRRISLLGPLHLLYLVTPFDMQAAIQLDPNVYYYSYTSLSSEDQNTASLIGVSEACVTHLMASRNLGKKVDLDVVHRFYLTLALYELWQQKPLFEVANKFNTHKGTLHQLLTRAAAFASSVCRFTQELEEMWALADLLPNFVKQLQFCCQKELVPLMEIPAVKQGRARQLYQAGYKTVAEVARAEANQLSQNIEHLPKKIARQIISAAKMLLLERAEALQEEAQELVEGLGEGRLKES